MTIRVNFNGYAPAVQMSFQLPRGKKPADYASSLLSMLIAEEFQSDMHFEIVGEIEARPLKQPKPLKRLRRGRPEVSTADDVPQYFKRLCPDYMCGNLNSASFPDLLRFPVPRRISICLCWVLIRTTAKEVSYAAKGFQRCRHDA